MSERGTPVVHHRTDGALVYLDHAALMDIADRYAEEFADALARRKADLAISRLNFIELAEVSDETAKSVESLLRRVFPHVAFIELLFEKVIEEEDRLTAGRSEYPPHHDASLLREYIDHESINPIDPTSFFARCRTPDAIESARRGWGKGIPPSAAAIAYAQAIYQSDPVVRRRINRRPTGDPAIRPTRYVADEADKFLIKNRLRTTDGRHTRDHFHLVVPLSYCDFVVLDANWHEAARQIQNTLRETGLLSHVAKVFRTKDVAEFVRVFAQEEPRGVGAFGES